MTEQVEEVKDVKDLKIQALLERISQLTAQYENQDADRRVTITILGNRVKELEQTTQEEVDIEQVVEEVRQVELPTQKKSTKGKN